MFNSLRIVLALQIFLHVIVSLQTNKRIVCYYNYRDFGFDQTSLTVLTAALPWCSHLVYSTAGLSSGNYEISSLNHQVVLNYRRITALKKEYPHLKVYLSLGGVRDLDAVPGNKYIPFLKSSSHTSNENFINISMALLKASDFDGLDLVFQFPHKKPRKAHSEIGMYWRNIKQGITSDFIVDPDFENPKQQFTQFVEQIHREYSAAKLALSLTVLPHMNSALYFDIPKIQEKFEYINIFAFDFVNKEQDRLRYNNIDFQVQHWIDHGCPAQKLNMGIVTYGHASKTMACPEERGLSVVPTRRATSTKKIVEEPGLVSWVDVYRLIVSGKLGKIVGEIEKKYDNQIFYQNHGIWISFNNRNFAAINTDYAKQKGLGGMAFYDVTF